MKALVSGASGFIGSSFINKYLYKFDEIYTIGRSKLDECENIYFDFNDPKLTQLPNVDYFFHFAAQTSAGKALDDPTKDLRINVTSTVQIFEQFRKQKIVPSIILASSVTQKGYTKLPLKNPNDFIDDPICFYSLSKLAAEKYLRIYTYNGFCRGVSLRIANAFGRINDSGNSDRGVIDKALLKSLNGEGLEVWGSGDYVRDYIYVEDIIDAFWLASQKISKINSKNFDIGSGTGIKVFDAFKTVRKIAQEEVLTQLPSVVLKSDIEISNEMDKRSYIADISDFSKITGWAPKYNLETGLRNMIKKLHG